VRKRITDAFAWLGARPQAADATAVGGETAIGWGANGPGPGPGQAARDAGPSADGNSAGPAGRGPRGGKHTALVAGAGVLAVVAIGAVVVTPKLLGSSSDPGCKAYAGSTLTAYNKTIGDLNNQSSQQTLTKDMATTVTDLNGAIAQAQSTSVKTALNALLTELKTVQSDVGSGSVPSSTVSALNTASTTADNAC
jgi:putative serine protease PepD